MHDAADPLFPSHEAPLVAAAFERQWARHHRTSALALHTLWREDLLAIAPSGLLLAPRVGDLLDRAQRLLKDKNGLSAKAQHTGRALLIPTHVSPRHGPAGLVGRYTQGLWHVHPRPCLIAQDLFDAGTDAIDAAADALFARGVPHVSPQPDHPDHPAWALPRMGDDRYATHPSYALTEAQRADLHRLAAGALLAFAQHAGLSNPEKGEAAFERSGWNHAQEGHALPKRNAPVFFYHGEEDTRIARFERMAADVLWRWCATGRLPRFFFANNPCNGIPYVFDRHLSLDDLAPSAHARVQALAFWRAETGHKAS